MSSRKITPQSSVKVSIVVNGKSVFPVNNNPFFNMTNASPITSTYLVTGSRVVLNVDGLNFSLSPSGLSAGDTGPAITTIDVFVTNIAPPNSTIPPVEFLQAALDDQFLFFRFPSNTLISRTLTPVILGQGHALEFHYVVNIPGLSPGEQIQTRRSSSSLDPAFVAIAYLGIP